MEARISQQILSAPRYRYVFDAYHCAVNLAYLAAFLNAKYLRISGVARKPSVP
jgi:uncharacterized protein (UPF0332 family)